MKLKKCKVVMLPSNEVGLNKKGDVVKYNNLVFGGLSCGEQDQVKIVTSPTLNTTHWTKQHLYILSDDEIQVGDLIIDLTLNGLLNVHANVVRYRNVLDFKKIIATTDKSLNLPTISKGFIEKYVKKGGIDEVMVKYETLDFLINDIPVIRNNKISIRPVDSNRTTQMNLENVRFGYPMVHDAPLNTWCSSIFIEVNGYIVSFAGDDGNRGEKGEKSIRHYLSISKGNHDLTEELGFKTQDVTFLDFVNAIKKVESL